MKLYRTLLLPFITLSLCLTALSTRANVYATQIKLNGGTTNVTLGNGGSVLISYILNENATSGVELEVLSNDTVVRTIQLTSGNPGTLRGANSVSWDGKDQLGNNVGAGIYSVKITAASAGFDFWTQISNDTDPGNYVYEPRGIAVNQNTNSPYYGRVFVSNARANPAGITVPGDDVGILKLNADGSAADEGIFSTGGYTWAGDFFSPWKMDVGVDDRLYVNDWTGSGIIIAFDQILSSNQMVLRDDNNPNGSANMTGPCVTSSGTNIQVWMADINYTSPAFGTGITRWNVTADGTLAIDDKGTKIVQALGGSDLNLYPYDVAVDKNGKVYTVQYRANPGDAANRVMRFPAYDENLATPATVADWKIGSGDDSLRQVFGIAVNPSATFVAVAIRGVSGDGGIAIFNADTGDLLERFAAPQEDHRDIAWDAAGNLYAVDNAASLWRAYSPPGANQSTTVALSTISVGSSVSAPVLSAPNLASGQFQFTLAGQANQQYVIQSSTDLQAWSPVVTNTSASAVRTITVPAPATNSFYRAVAP